MLGECKQMKSKVKMSSGGHPQPNYRKIYDLDSATLCLPVFDHAMWYEVQKQLGSNYSNISDTIRMKTNTTIGILAKFPNYFIHDGLPLIKQDMPVAGIPASFMGTNLGSYRS